MESSNSPSSVLEDLERTFVASDRSGFETVLFSAIKSAALSTCQPKVATAEDAAASLSSQSIDETSIEAELFEYNKLLDSIFAAFEDFLANSEIPECGSAGGSVGDDNDSLSRLKKKLGVVCPKVRTPCGQIFMDQEPTFRCKDCSTDPTCALCRTCFFASIHANHRYKMHASGGGYCDCGDEEAWTSGAWCRIHAGEGDVETGDGKSSGADTFRSVSEELNLEMELVRSRLSKLPVDVIRRCTYLLEPLVNSASVVLFELLQGSPRTDYPALSSTHSKQEVGAEKPRDFDTAEAECFWPPPLSHLPSTSASEDASQLGIGHFPHTCPSNRDAGHMEARCLAQQSRAHRLHPALFDSVDGDVVSGVKNHYTVILYNNEYHNYEDVIKTVRRLDGCTAKQATLFAIIVNRDGRTPLLTHLTRQSACEKAARVSHSASTRHMIRPLRSSAMDHRVYALESFFVSVLRWLQRLASSVHALRPLICNAILGRFALTTSEAAEVIRLPGEMMLPNCLLAHILERFTLSHRGVRKTASRLIAGVFLQEPYHRRIFSIEFTRHFETICQAYIYDDHLEADNLFALTCQFYTVISLARQLLQHHSVLQRILSRLARTVAHNSQPLPAFYEVSHSNITLASLLSPKLPALPSVFETRLRALRSANPQAWARAHEALTSGEAEPRAFVWRHVPDERPEFCPFERILHTTYDLRYVLTSLLNVRPLAGESSKCPSSWWGVNARKNFMVFFRTLLEMLGNLQDMNGMQRAVRIHVEIEQEWISTFKMMSHLIYVLNLTVQVASSDRVLLIEAIKETREAYEKRVGLFDRCFRVKPFDGPYASSEGINGLTVQCLGATSEIYEYDVSAFRVSVMQPLPRLLAALYGHALEMGLSPVQVGLADEGFANLIIERPLQTISFVAQCSANFWVRNGLIVENIIYNMYNGLRVEMVDRNYQLLQQAATVLPADELIVRMIHKLNLHEFMCGELSHVKPGTVQFVEALLRTILYLVTHRSRDGVGYFDPLIVSSTPSSLNLFPEKLNEIDEYLEANYGQLIDDVVHALCTKAMTHSELFSALPHQPPGCVLRKPPPYQPSNSEEDTRLNMRGSRKDTIERPLAKILQQIATPATSGSKQVFSIKPEVILSRFNRFYPGYKHTDQTVAEENVARVLKKWLQEPGNPVALRCRGLPVPPPPPRPRRRFVRPMEKPLLQLVRCTTFVRLVRRLLDAELSYGRVQSWWSETINELVLHLIIVALYEDAITFAEKGEKPFLDVVSRVPNTAESDAELENLAASRHWTKQQTPASPSSSSPTNNCIVPRLTSLLERQEESPHADLLRWTLKLWDDVVAKPHDEAFAGVVEVKNVDSPTSEKQRKLEAKRQRQAKILDKMSEMQRKFLEAHCQEMSNVEENDTPMDTTPPPGSASSTSHPSTLEDSSDRAVALFSAMGPHRFEERRCQLEEKVKTTVTCVLCLEEIPESDKHNVVVAAYGCRSNVLSMPLFHGEAVDFVNETCQSDCSEYNLAAIATTAVAASLGSNESNMTQLPRLVCGVNAAGEDASPTKPSGSSDSNQSHAAPSAKPNSLDPWFPRPLVSSRCPVGEEGTFISTCPHLMHAGCKERYAAQLKSQNEQLTRQHRYANKPPLYEFRCSLCRSLANFDVPLFGRLHDTLPEAWVARCLKKPFDFANWLKTLHTWLKDCSCLPSAPLQQVTFNMSELPDAPESFTNLFVALGDSFSQHCDDLLAKICASCERAFCKPDPESAAEDEEEVEEPEDDGRPPSTPRRIRLCLSRGLFRRFLLRRSETVPSEDSSAHPSRSTSTLPLVFVPLLQRPPQDSVKVSADLWTFVQRLVTISQPKPIQSLQRNAMRAQFLESGNLVTEILQALNNAQEAVNLVVNANLEGDDEAFGEDDGMEGGGGETAIETVLSHRPPADRRHSSIGGSGVDDGGLPPSLSEAAEELHTSLVSSYSHLMVLSGKDETTAGTGRHLTQSISRLKAALVCTRRRSFQAILAAACEWRALRHSIAYTLVIWERSTIESSYPC
uniref:E3 ubiquitin-protein ligase n=1 Tax=Mesocestoides corti TaxID=53468 RepID=A0A5K3ETL7_MESCO